MAQAMEGTASGTTPEATLSESQAIDLVSKLPAREGWSQTLVLYRNYWLRQHLATTIMRLQNSFKPRHDDVILATNPKCGTTWIKALTFTITNRSRYEFANHPLLSRHPQQVVPFVEIPWTDGDHQTYIETLSSPRLLSTHTPLSLLPKSIVSCGCRIVYVCRDAKDAFVSRWHFENKICKDRDIDLESAFSMFSEGCSPYGPFWDHCLEYWKESITSPDKVLFLNYEDMISEPVKHITKLAIFLGAPFSIKEEEDRVPEEVVRLCSFERLSGLHGNQTGDDDIFRRCGNMVLEKSAFFRSGKVGDWVNHISEDMGRKLDCIVEEKLKGSGLVL